MVNKKKRRNYRRNIALGALLAKRTKNKVVRSENLTVGTGPHGIHGTGFQVQQDRTGDILASYVTEKKHA